MQRCVIRFRTAYFILSVDDLLLTMALARGGSL
jgi:hypothetical protein